jgi:hypothetical protein
MSSSAQSLANPDGWVAPCPCGRERGRLPFRNGFAKDGMRVSALAGLAIGRPSRGPATKVPVPASVRVDRATRIADTSRCEAGIIEITTQQAALAEGL